MTKTLTNDEAQKLLDNRWWRLRHLYWIQDKRGNKVLFEPNEIQRKLHTSIHYLNIILKARQLGISTYISILLLDVCIFCPNQAAGIIAHTQEDAKKLFTRIKFAYDNLPADLKKLVPATNDSARELVFTNGSSIRVGTSMRGSTLQYLHISEFGKICKKYPEKAQEIVTGALNTIAPGQYVFIESTAEGREGYFYDMCKQAQAMHDNNEELSKLDYKFHFFPWYEDPSYQLGNSVHITKELNDYFLSLDVQGIKLTDFQKNWYAKQLITQKDDIKREFPSTPDEAWEVANIGTYYAKQITLARHEDRVGPVKYDISLPVHTAWDLGMRDMTSIWYFQVYRGQIRCIEFEEASGISLEQWLIELQKKPYFFGRHLAPHDISVRELNQGITRFDFAKKMGVNFIQVERSEIMTGIDRVRNLLNRTWFDEVKCKAGLQALENYRKDWDDRLGTWKSGPRHDQYSHAADAFRTLAVGMPIVESANDFTGRTNFEQMKDSSGLSPGNFLYDSPTQPHRKSIFPGRYPGGK